MSRLRARSWVHDGEFNIIRQNTQHRAEHILVEVVDEKPRSGPKVKSFSKAFYLLISTCILIILYHRLPLSGVREEFVSNSPDHKLGPANFHLVVSAAKSNANLCRLIVSAAVTGYPSPIVVNWNHSDGNSQSAEADRRMTKVGSVHDFLTQLDPTQDDDLILIVDGYDVLMQLRPQVLIERYFAINRRADDRIAKELGAAARKNDIRQEIIFGSQRRCSPWNSDDPPCYAMPQSTVPDDIYGPQTDQSIGDGSNPYSKYRQRFSNSGIIIGTARALRRVFEQAKDSLEKDRTISRDQDILSQILGDQQVWREAMRRDSSWGGTKIREMLWSDKSRIKFSRQQIDAVRAKAASREDKNFEFSIGLDYEGLIGFHTSFAEDDAQWLTWSDPLSLRAAETKLNIPADRSRMRSLSEDIRSSVPPFWTFSHEKALSRGTKWQHVQLFTNVWTGNVPAVIHYDAHGDGGDAGEVLRETGWKRIWFHQHSRTLFDTFVYEPVLPVANDGYNASSRREYWPFERWRAGMRDGAGPWGLDTLGRDVAARWLPFYSICNQYVEEIFQDGKGPWILPKVH